MQLSLFNMYQKENYSVLLFFTFLHGVGGKVVEFFILVFNTLILWIVVYICNFRHGLLYMAYTQSALYSSISWNSHYKISQPVFQMCSNRHIPVLDDYLQQPELQKLMSGLQACRQEIGSSFFSRQKDGNKYDGSNCICEWPISKTVTTYEKE